jgi:hypothetical protein
MGATRQNAIIYSNDPDQPTITVSIGGMIKPFISVEPGPRVLFSGFYGDNLEQVLRIASNTEEPLSITGVSSTIDDKIEYTLKTEKQDKEYTLAIKTRGGIKETFRGTISLKTTAPKKPEIPVQVMANLKKEVKVIPEYLYFGIIDTGKGTLDETRLTRTAVISHQQSADLTLKKIETSKEWIAAEARTDQAGKEYTVTITLKKDTLPKGKFRETVSIQTQSGNRDGSATIIVEGKVL